MASIRITGGLSEAVVASLKDPKVAKRVNLALVKKAIMKTAKPVAVRAREHYANVLEEVTEFVTDSGVGNAGSGIVSRSVGTLGGGSTSVESLVPWEPLSKEYIPKKKSSTIWQNTGKLAKAIAPLRQFAKIKASGFKINISPKIGRRAGTFNFAITFQQLPRVLNKAVAESFVDGEAVDPATLPTDLSLNAKRDGINKLIFLERYKADNVRGGPGRPMITAIAGALGNIMKKDLIALVRKGS